MYTDETLGRTEPNNKRQESIASLYSAARLQQPRFRWLPFMSVLLLMEAALLLHLLSQNLEFWEYIHRLKEPLRQEHRASHVAALMKNDPLLGSKPLERNGEPLKAAARMVAGKEQIVCVFLGPCTSCTSPELWEWSDLRSTHGNKPIIVISRDSKESIRNFVKAERFPLPIVPDPDGKIAEAFNAIWTPRVYGLRKDGTLTWIQTDDRMPPSMMADAVWNSDEGKIDQ